MPYSYILLGAGRQGVAAAYDVARFGDAKRLTIADVDLEHARSAAERINKLTGSQLAQPLAVDVRDSNAARKVLAGHDVALSAVPYFFNLELAKAAIDARVSFCDLGGNTDIVRQQHALDPEAKRAGVRVIPDCGMGPGMGNTLAVYAMGLVQNPEHVYLYDGGLPQNPQPPWNYQLSFNVIGLTNEYYGGMEVLREGKLVHTDCFTEFEEIDFPPLGKLESFLIAGGCSTAPWTFQGKLKTYQLKVLRYPGTFAQLKAFNDLGLFDPKPVPINGYKIAPREMFHALFEPKVFAPVVKDVCIIRAHAIGKAASSPSHAVVDVVDYYDEPTGFSAMQRTTGWHLSIVGIMMARGETPIGAVPLELAVPGDSFVREARKRGFRISEKVG